MISVILCLLNSKLVARMEENLGIEELDKKMEDRKEKRINTKKVFEDKSVEG